MSPSSGAAVRLPAWPVLVLCGGATVITVVVAGSEAARDGDLGVALLVGTALAMLAAGAALAMRRNLRERRAEAAEYEQGRVRWRALVDVIPDAELRIDRVGRIIGVKAGTLPGVGDLRTVLGRTLAELPAPAGPALAGVAATARRDGSSRAVFRSPEGRHLDVRSAAAGDEVVIVVRDDTERVTAEAELRESEARFRLIAENSGDVVMRTSPDARIDYVSPSVRELLGWTVEQISGRRVSEVVDPGDWPEVSARVKDAVGSGVGVFRLPDHRMRRRDGAPVWVETTCRLLRDPAGRVEGLVSTIRAVGDRRRAEEALRLQTAETDRLAAEQGALRRVATAVAGGRPADEVENICAEEAGRLLAAGTAAVVRLDGREIVVRGAWSSTDPAIARMAGLRLPADALGALIRGGAAVRLPDSGLFPAGERGGELVAAPVRVSGRVWGAIIVRMVAPGDPERLKAFAELLEAAIDNAESRAELASRADRDSLTGMLNHRAFHERLSGAVAVARASRGDVCVALVDIDNFRSVNEVHGHQTGDEVLSRVASVIRETAREGDHVARIGGEEFAWVMPGASAGDGVRAAERLTRALRRRPVPGVGTVTVSVGVCDLASADRPEDLVRLADGALYWAKANGRDRVVAYAADTVRELSVRDRAERLERERALYGIRALARAVDARDSATHRHSERVAAISVRLAERLGADRDLCRRLHAAALVHDVGKIGVPDAVLLKPGVLDEDELVMVRRHAELGAEIVQEVLAPDEVEWVRSHHERWDGSGYPHGLAGSAIPWGARLMAVADSWDVMTADRPYRRALGTAEAMAELRRCAGTQFDPRVAAAMLEMLSEDRLGGGPVAWMQSGTEASRAR